MIEIGTLGGYSAIWLGRALAPGGRLVTVEIDPGRAAFARGFLARAGLADRVTVLEGAAIEVIPAAVEALGGTIDVAFLDAVKSEYRAYVEALRGHLAQGVVSSRLAMADPAYRLVDPNAPNDPAVEAAFQAVPDTSVAEILDGELHVQSRPVRRHTRASSTLGGELHAPFGRGTGGPGGWVILDEPELHLGPKPDKVVPDLAGWRRDRMPDAIGPDDAPAYYELPPD